MTTPPASPAPAPPATLAAPAPPLLPPSLSPHAQDLAQLQYNHVEQQAALATTKASLLVTAHSIIFATYVSLAKDCSVFTSLKFSLAGVAFALSGVLLLAGLLLALAAVYPRTDPNARDDVLYFANVVKEWPTFPAFWDAFRARDASGQLDRDILLNIHGKSDWLMRNFGLVKRSLWASGIGTIAAVLALFPFLGIMHINCQK